MIHFVNKNVLAVTPDNISGWIAIGGSIVAIVISILMKKPQGDNLNANTIKTLTEAVGAANKNYDDLMERVLQMETNIKGLEKTVQDYECWNRALCAQLISADLTPISLEQAVMNAKRKSVKTIE